METFNLWCKSQAGNQEICMRSIRSYLKNPIRSTVMQLFDQIRIIWSVLFLKWALADHKDCSEFLVVLEAEPQNGPERCQTGSGASSKSVSRTGSSSDSELRNKPWEQTKTHVQKCKWSNRKKSAKCVKFGKFDRILYS